MTEEITADKRIKVFQSLNDFLADIWKSDDSRPWGHYIKEQKFSYFWDKRETPK